MSCCAKHREQWRGESPAQRLAPTAHGGIVVFQYVGRHSLTVVGPVTGRVYQFWGAGATAAIDPRDAPSVAAVPHVVQIRDLY